jgi:hypothetical protein
LGFGIREGDQQYVNGIFARWIILGAHIVSNSLILKTWVRNLFTKSPRPCHVRRSTIGYVIKFCESG